MQFEIIGRLFNNLLLLQYNNIPSLFFIIIVHILVTINSCHDIQILQKRKIWTKKQGGQRDMNICFISKGFILSEKFTRVSEMRVVLLPRRNWKDRSTKIIGFLVAIFVISPHVMSP